MRKSVQGETNVVYPTVVSLLRMRAEHQPRRVAYTFAPDCGGEQEITYSELDRWASAIACRLDEMDIRGKPAMLLYPPGIGFIAAFFGCLYAGAVAVPGCPPDPLRIDRSLPRLVAVARDAAPSVVLTTATMSTMLGSLSEALPELSGLRVMTTCDVATDRSGSWEPGPVEAESVALLQYTSGSTSAPKGVVLTHRNLMSNSELIFRFFGHSEESRGVSWLPVYHDMGLIGGILQPLYGGFPVTLMAPADFARQPLSWLQEISRTRATTSGGPNFAYDLCVRKTTAAQRAGLDLSSWRVAFNGSEPIRAETMENFARAFEPAGFSREAFHPCYGLAEATLIVTGGLPWSRRGVTSFDAARLRDGTAVSSAADTSSRRLVSCGFASRDRDLVIADPDTRVERAAGQVGEIWISGHGAAPSYWRRPAETRETFGAYLAGTSEVPFLRSGDLGFVLGRQLFVTGRIKDLIIIRGRNHYPQDIEWTAERSSPVLRRGGAAAFSVPHEDQERLVVAQEITRQAGDVSISEVAGAIRAAVAAAHEVQVHTVVLLPPGEIPKTSSGKVQRSLCAAMFAAGQLAELGRSEISSAAETGQLHLDRSSLLSVAAGERRGLLEDYLCRLVASACGIDAAKVADSPLLALGIDSYAVISIQHVIQTDLSVRITAVDLAHATSVADLAVRLDEQLMATAAAARADVSAVARRPELAVTDKASARLYCWVRGSRVSADAAPDADPFPDPGGRQAGEQPCWASLSAAADRQHRRESRRPGPWLRSDEVRALLDDSGASPAAVASLAWRAVPAWVWPSRALYDSPSRMRASLSWIQTLVTARYLSTIAGALPGYLSVVITVQAAAVQAAARVAAGLGVTSDEPVVLADGANVIVHLRPSPVVAKVAASTAAVRADTAGWLRRELDLAQFLAAAGVPVMTPSPEIPATTYHGDGLVMSFWRYLRSSGGALPDEATIGSMLRDLHAALRSYPDPLPVLAPLGDIPAFLARSQTRLSPAQSVALSEAYARLTAELDLASPPGQALHGDAGAGNLMDTNTGWVWHDFEDTCSGPVAWDLAASTASQRLDGRRVLAAYGAPVDAGQLAVCEQLRRLHLTVWYALYAERLPDLRSRAAGLLALWSPG